MRERLPDYDFTKFNPIKPKLLDVVDGMLASDIGEFSFLNTYKQIRSVFSSASFLKW